MLQPAVGLLRALPLILFALSACRSVELRQGFYVSGSAPELEEKLASLKKTRETWTDFLPVQEPVQIYLQSRRELPPALYDSESGWISLDPAMPVESFRHEVAHRLLDLNQKSKDYWYQEGVALFLEAGSDASCGALLKLPARIVATLDESIPPELPWQNQNDLANAETARELRASAAAFFHFLWREKDFRNFMNAPDPEASFEKHRKGFELYLKLGEYRRATPGC